MEHVFRHHISAFIVLLMTHLHIHIQYYIVHISLQLLQVAPFEYEISCTFVRSLAAAICQEWSILPLR